MYPEMHVMITTTAKTRLIDHLARDAREHIARMPSAGTEEWDAHVPRDDKSVLLPNVSSIKNHERKAFQLDSCPRNVFFSCYNSYSA